MKALVYAGAFFDAKKLKGRLNMTRKFLENMGLSKEQADSVLDENSRDIGKAKGDFDKLKSELDTANSEIESLKTTLTERDDQLETLKNSKDDIEGLKNQISTLQTENKTKDEAHAAEIKQLKVDAAVTTALTAAKAKNIVAVKALLKDLDKAELMDDGSIKGLSEQIDALSKAKDSEFLFDTSTQKPTFRGAAPGQSGDDEGGKADFSKMTYSEMAAYLSAHPDTKID